MTDKLDAREFMGILLGSPKEKIARFLINLTEGTDISFSEEEVALLLEMLDDPQERLHISDMIFKGAEDRGMIAK